jgi:hypothetical protein
MSEIRLFARVLGCIRPGVVDCFLSWRDDTQGSAIPTPLPIDAIPIELRFPNSRFAVTLNDKWEVLKVEPLPTFLGPEDS